VQGSVFVRVPQGLQQPERVVAVPWFVRLRSVDECMRFWPETPELLSEQGADFRVVGGVVKEDGELDASTPASSLACAATAARSSRPDRQTQPLDQQGL